MTTPKMTREALRETGEEVRRSMGHAIAPDGSIPTSPELGTYSTEAIFGSVWARPGLDRRYRMLATLAALTATRELVELRIYIGTALNGLLTPLEIQEALLQCSPFAGLPAALNAMSAMREVFEERGVTLEPPERPYVSIEELERRGRAARERVLGAAGARNPVFDMVPGLGELLWRYPFGEIFHRPGLDTKSRVVLRRGRPHRAAGEHAARNVREGARPLRTHPRRAGRGDGADRPLRRLPPDAERAPDPGRGG